MSSDVPRGRPFEEGKSGNPKGRPLGAKNRTTLAAQALLEGEAEALSRKAVELALAGDLTALRLCLDRVVPLCRERTISFEMAEISSINGAPYAVASIITAVAAGEITLSEATQLGKLVELYVSTYEASRRESRADLQMTRQDEDRREEKDRRRRLGGF